MSRFVARKKPFGGTADAQTGKPSVLVRKAIERRAAQIREASTLLDHLPEPGHSFHALMTGRYDLMDVITALAAREPLTALRIATLSYNARNLQALLALLDGGKVQAASLLCSAFFRDQNKELWAESVSAFRERGMRLAAARSHAKVICLDLPGRGKLVCYLRKLR